MRVSMFTGLSLFLSLALVGVVSAEPHAPGLGMKRAHAGKRQTALSSRSATSLEKRFDSARFSFFADGTGACGKNNSPGDFIVALNSAQYDGGSHCFETITITYGGLSTQAQITDECPGCPYGGLDFSTGLFDFFAPQSVGILYGSWVFGSGTPAPSSSSTPPAPTSTWVAPTSTWVAPTSTWVAPTSTWSSSSKISTSSSASSSSAASSVAKSSSSGTPTTLANIAIATAGALTPSEPQVINQLNLAFIGLAELLSVGIQVSN